MICEQNKLSTEWLVKVLTEFSTTQPSEVIQSWPFTADKLWRTPKSWEALELGPFWDPCLFFFLVPLKKFPYPHSKTFYGGELTLDILSTSNRYIVFVLKSHRPSISLWGYIFNFRGALVLLSEIQYPWGAYQSLGLETSKLLLGSA
jgi:hypothetical protein